DQDRCRRQGRIGQDHGGGRPRPSHGRGRPGGAHRRRRREPEPRYLAGARRRGDLRAHRRPGGDAAR
ncbi:MAG: hypothetical protein AVDCRST_MAG10-3285, partial [uncultured Acidimicrobiales bacterium]